jgi:hypothetical protein
MNVPPLDSPNSSVPWPVDMRVGQKATDALISAIIGTQKTIVEKVNRQISLGTGRDFERLGNVDAQVRIITAPAVAETEFEIRHGLGRLPCFFFVLYKSGYCDVKASRSESWTTEVIYLKCNTASVALTIAVA